MNLVVDFVKDDEDVVYEASLYNAIFGYTQNDIVYIGTMPGFFFICTVAQGVFIVGQMPPNTLYWSSIAAQSVHSIRLVIAHMEIAIPLIVHVNDYYYITVRNDSEHLNLTAEYEVQAGDTYVQVKAGLEADLVARGVDAADIEVGADPTKI
jgi:hypothetical protein